MARNLRPCVLSLLREVLEDFIRRLFDVVEVHASISIFRPLLLLMLSLLAILLLLLHNLVQSQEVVAVVIGGCGSTLHWLRLGLWLHDVSLRHLKL